MGKLSALHVIEKKYPKPGWYYDEHGLYLQVNGNHVKSWLFRYMLKGQAHAMGLGPVHTVSLAEAREKARECRKLLLDGIDPLEAKRENRLTIKVQKARGITFSECAKAYGAAHRAAWKNASDWIDPS